MELFSIIIIALIVLLLILVFINIYNNKSLPKCEKKQSIPPGSHYQYDNKLPEGWNLPGTNNNTITPNQTSGVNMF